MLTTLDEIDRAIARKSHMAFMRYCWSKSEPLIEGFHTKKICERIDKAFIDFKNGKSTYLAIKIPFRHGKLLADDTPILTVGGWKTHGELAVGDYVFGRDGKPKKVLAEINHSISPDADYEVTFSTGEKIVAHAHHEWVVYDKGKHREVTLETRDMVNRLLMNDGRARYYVDANTPIDFEESELPIHPYFLGLWLGDGHTQKCTINHDKNDIEDIAKLQNLGIVHDTVWVHPQTGVLTYSYRSLSKTMKTLGFGFEKGLKKHIPKQYLFSSIEQRKELLAGLIDSDGHTSKDGRIRFVNTNKELIDNVRDLVYSLGYNAYISSQKANVSSSGIVGRQTVYTIGFQPTSYLPIALPRKMQSRLKRDIKRGITSIRVIEAKLGKCITVEDGIYLAGRSLVPTHNSDMISRFLPPHFLGEFPECELISTSYSSDLTNKFSRDARNILKSKEYRQLYPKSRLSRTTSNVREWALDNEVGRTLWTGLGGGMTGNGAHLALVDDPFKGREEAESEKIRQKRWECFQDDFFSRLAPVHIVILLATPWHVDDLFGKIKKKMAEDEEFPIFEELCFPARASHYKGEGQYPGEFLFEERYSSEWYNTQYAIRSAYASSGLLDCDPTVRVGGLIKTNLINWVDEKPLGFGLFGRAWDLASSEKQTQKEDPDWTISVKGAIKIEHVNLGFGQTEKIYHLYIDDITRCRKEATDRNLEIVQTAKADGRVCTQFIESFAAYKDAYTTIARVLDGVATVEKAQLPGDKVVKAATYIQDIFDKGRVYINKNIDREILAEYLKTLENFPSYRHDDDVDATAVLVAKLSEKGSNIYFGAM